MGERVWQDGIFREHSYGHELTCETIFHLRKWSLTLATDPLVLNILFNVHMGRYIGSNNAKHQFA